MKYPCWGSLALVTLFLSPAHSDAGLLAYYPFDSDFSDATANSNDLSTGGGTPNITTTSGEFVFGNGALNLDKGSDEFLTPTTNFSFSASDSWSVSFWAKRRAGAAAATGMVMGDNTTNDSFIWLTDNGNQVQGMRFRPVGVGTGDNNDYATGHDNNFHHWAVVADGSGTIRVYRDNVDLGTRSPSGGTDFDIKAVGSGYTGSNQIFDGQIDELYIFDEAIGAAKIAELYSGSPDETPPTLSGSDIADDRAGGPVTVSSLVTYTISFSEDMDESAVDASDFGNAGDANFSIGAITETSPGVFTVEVTPSSAGTLRLQVNQNAVLSDPAGNNLETRDGPIPDDTIITVELSDSTAPTLTGGDFSDDQGGGPVSTGASVTYTLTFSEDMDESTVDAPDFGNAGDASFSIGAITEISPGVFTVEITPTSAGTLRLQVIAGAILSDVAGNPLDTTVGITSDVIIDVEDAFDPLSVKRLRVFLLGGQSNADGRAHPSELPTSPVNLQLPQDDVDFYETGLTTLRPVGSQFGPEVTLGRRLADSLGNEPGTRVAIIKYAAGGTSLHTDWVAGGDATNANDGPRYVSFQAVVGNGLAALASAYPNAVIETTGMLWVQGERDAGSAEAENYGTNLANFIADIRLTYGSSLWFIISRLSDSQTAINVTGLAAVRDAQSAVAAADPLTALLDTDGFGMKSDNLHFDGLGQQQIGNGAATWLLDFLPFLRPPQIAPQSNGDFKVVVNLAFDGFQYTLQGNPDLKPENWQDLETVTASAPVVTFNHAPAQGIDREFYRVGRSKAP